MAGVGAWALLDIPMDMGTGMHHNALYGQSREHAHGNLDGQRQTCKQCLARFVPKRPWQTFCTKTCQMIFGHDEQKKMRAAYRAARIKE